MKTDIRKIFTAALLFISIISSAQFDGEEEKQIIRQMREEGKEIYLKISVKPIKDYQRIYYCVLYNLNF